MVYGVYALWDRDVTKISTNTYCLCGYEIHRTCEDLSHEVVTEWSKVLCSGHSVFVRAGSNPVNFIVFVIIRKNFTHSSQDDLLIIPMQ